MLALRKTAPGFGLALEEAPEAHPPGPGEVVLEVEAAGICGSDVHAYEWTEGYGFMVPHLPVVMGHEFSARVIRPGTGSGFEAGARVCVIPFVSCGACPECRAGQPRECSRRETIGLTRDGGFARQVRVPSRCCIPLPENVDNEVGALAEPLGVALEAVLTAGCRGRRHGAGARAGHYRPGHRAHGAAGRRGAGARRGAGGRAALQP